MSGRQVKIQFPLGKQAEIEIPDTEAWNLLIQQLASELKPGTIITLSGPLGAGKTTFVQALASFLGAKKQAQSPTFALMRSYPIKRQATGLARLIHVDAYRFETESEMSVLDLEEELADQQSLLVLEWPEKIPQWIAQHRAHIVHIQICL